MHLPHRRLANVNRSHCPNDLNSFDFNNVKMFFSAIMALHVGLPKKKIIRKIFNSPALQAFNVKIGFQPALQFLIYKCNI